MRTSRLLAAVAALVLLAAPLVGCADGDDDEVTIDPFGLEDDSEDPAQGGGPAGEPDGSADDSGGGDGGGPAGDGSGSGSGSGGDGDGSPTTAPGGEAPPPASLDPGGPPGSFAPALLRPEPADRLVVDVLVQPGAEPTRGAVEHAVSTLGDVSGKPVEVVRGTVPGDRTQWSADDVRAAADRTAITPQGGGAAVIRLLFLRGQLSEEENALGVAVRGDVAAVFSERVEAAASPLIGSRAIGEAVTLHEVGHLLGLVDLYLDTGRADPDHPGHSPNRGSVMFWAVESTLVGDILTGGPPRQFDAADRADLQRIRSGA